MRRNRVLALLGGAAAAAGAIASAPGAQAACAWGPYGWTCDQPMPPQVAVAPATQVPNSPLPAVPPGTNWGEQRYTPSGYNYNNYNQIPNDYPGPALTSPQGGDGRS